MWQGGYISEMRRAIYPGTFDPITCGHAAIIERAAALFDEVIVAVIDLPAHKKSTLFELEERMELVQITTTHLENVCVDAFDELVVEYARRVEAGYLVRGLRAISDFEYEFEINQLNRHLDPGIESVYLMSAPDHSFVSSSGVKEIASFGGNVSDLVHTEVAERLLEKLG